MSRSLHDHFRIGNNGNGTNGSGHENGDRLFFNPRMLGGNVPFRGPSFPPLSREEMDEFLETRVEGKVDTFDLGDPQRKEDYETVLHRICNGWYIKLHAEHHWDAARGVMVVYLEWCQPYKELPAHMRDVLGYGQNKPVPPVPAYEREW